MLKLKKYLARGCATAVLATGASAQDVTTLTVWRVPTREPIHRAYDAARENVELNFVSVARNEFVAKL